MPLHDRYASYLLRLQGVQDDNRPTLLVSIQSTKTGEVRWFPGLDALTQFLQAEFGECEMQLESTEMRAEQNSKEQPDMVKE